MTDGYCCIFTKEKNGHRFTDDIASAHNNTFFAVDIDIAAFKKLNNAGRCTGDKTVFTCDKGTYIAWMEAVNIL